MYSRNLTMQMYVIGREYVKIGMGYLKCIDY